MESRHEHPPRLEFETYVLCVWPSPCLCPAWRPPFRCFWGLPFTSCPTLRESLERTARRRLRAAKTFLVGFQSFLEKYPGLAKVKGTLCMYTKAPPIMRRLGILC